MPNASPSSTLKETPGRTDLTERVRRFRRNLRYFAAAALRIRGKEPPSSGELPYLEFNFSQAHVHRVISTQRRATGRVRIIILKARQQGISTYVAARFMRSILLWRNLRAVVIADVGKRSQEIFQIYDRYYSNLDPDLDPGHETRQRKKELGLRNGSELIVETAKDLDAGRASTPHRLHVTELASWDHAEDVWISIVTPVPTRGSEIIVESTAAGVGNYFHYRWERARSGETGYIAIFLPWFVHEEYVNHDVTEDVATSILTSEDPFEREAQDVGILWPTEVTGDGEYHKLTVAQLAWRRSTIADNYNGDLRAFQQEYPSTDEEAFLVSGGAFFDPEALKRQRMNVRPPMTRGWFVKEGSEASRATIFQPDSRGRVRLWEAPRPGHYVMGADTAEGKLAAATDSLFSDPASERGGRDFNSCDVIKLGEWTVDGSGKALITPCREQVAQVHGYMAPEVFAEQCYALGVMYGCTPQGSRDVTEPALAGIERNHSSGQTTIRWMRDHGYQQLYRRRWMNRNADGRPTPDFGFWTDTQTRRPMLDHVASCLRDNSLVVRSEETLREMRTFVLADDGEPEAQEGCHDDRVFSIGIALEMERTHTHGASPDTLPEPEVKNTPTGR